MLKNDENLRLESDQMDLQGRNVTLHKVWIINDTEIKLQDVLW
jgi:hypothetical protein